MPKGMVFYEGPSEIDKTPIIGIATLNTTNPKTGPMVQTWILSAETPPFEAVKSGADKAVCGDCPLRNNGCYVRTATAPENVWKAWKRGVYGPYNRLYLLNRTVRLGAYGDPAALPLGVVKRLVFDSIGYTGYTHQWRWATHLIPYCMASVENLEEYDEAKLNGWRAFRIRPEGTTRTPVLEAQCPAAAEHEGVKIACHQCLACCGTSKGTGDISIEVHGYTKRRVFDGTTK